MTAKTNQPAGLITVVLNQAAPFGDRHDAAMDLGEYDEPEAEAALLQLVQDQSVDPDIADAAGESIWSIWSRQDRSEPALIESFHPEARKFFVHGRA
ncbi:hypothetical protein [Thermomonas carbonis]|uniref:Uncharacterized protein n=1 Tax=Thermomonas carbonis TaxID=1463158 RepID=A0A7G9SNL6_9GAMM|nr:hypothetical protein [Thermomonas carbonis]QNN69441.1 hypothetical protein H9L16_12250 [Thermomonas carbonis]